MLNDACRRILGLVIALLPADYNRPQEIKEASITNAARACRAYRDLVARTAGPADPAESRQRVETAHQQADAIAARSGLASEPAPRPSSSSASNSASPLVNGHAATPAAKGFDVPKTLSIDDYKKQIAAHPPTPKKDVN